VLPKRNDRNLEDIPSEVKKKMQFIFVSNIREAINYVLRNGDAGERGAERTRKDAKKKKKKP